MTMPDAGMPHLDDIPDPQVIQEMANQLCAKVEEPLADIETAASSAAPVAHQAKLSSFYFLSVGAGSEEDMPDSEMLAQILAADQVELGNLLVDTLLATDSPLQAGRQPCFYFMAGPEPDAA